MKGIWSTRIFTVLILLFLSVGAVINIGLLAEPIQNLVGGESNFEDFIAEVKEVYVSDLAGKEAFINLNGLFAKLTGRTVYNEVAVLNNGMLDYDTLPKLDMTDFANGVDAFDAYLQEKEIPFLYVQAPCKSDLSDMLIRDGVENYGNTNANELLALLEDAGVSSLDLRTSISATPQTVEQYFYNTDHHWNTNGAFVAFGEILNALNKMLPEANLDLSLADAESWNIRVYEDWCLGSRGKRVGVCYGGVDDLYVYTPDFQTEMSMNIPKHGAAYRGSFEETVMHTAAEYLDAPDYFNQDPYYIYIGGDYPLVQHTNALAQNDLKVLVIKDSFTIPVQAFLSTAVAELEVLDPRYFNECSIAEYVEQSQPDVVIMMVNPSMFGSKSYYRTGAEDLTGKAK
ncbi:MAG: hypothetical protein IJW92_01720 [Clostridia bacterium]|nr:hypothetical protein [Clostridia bacterium]